MYFLESNCELVICLKRAFKTDLVFELVVTRWSQSCRTESDQISRSEGSVLTQRPVGD